MKRFRLEGGGLREFQLASPPLDEPFILVTDCDARQLSQVLQLAGGAIQGLEWRYTGKEPPQCRLPPGLVTLRLQFAECSVIDFATSALTQCSLLKYLELVENEDGNVPALFAALGASSLTHLALKLNARIRESLFEYLVSDVLENLSVRMPFDGSPAPLLGALKKCTKLKALTLLNCPFSGQALMNLPRSVRALRLDFARFYPDFDWSFLAQVTDLGIALEIGLDRTSMCRALAARLERGPMERLSVMAARLLPDLRFDKIEKLHLAFETSEDLLKAIVAALLLPGSRLRELHLQAPQGLIQAHLLPALRDPKCSLTKLKLERGGPVAGQVEAQFNQRQGLFLLLQGQQVRRLPLNPLRRLPVEMFRLVGMTLM